METETVSKIPVKETIQVKKDPIKKEVTPKKELSTNSKTSSSRKRSIAVAQGNHTKYVLGFNFNFLIRTEQTYE